MESVFVLLNLPETALGAARTSTTGCWRAVLRDAVSAPEPAVPAAGAVAPLLLAFWPRAAEAEVEAVLGRVVRGYAMDSAWFYPKDPEQHGKGAAVGMFLRAEGERKVYRTDFNEVEGRGEEEE